MTMYSLAALYTHQPQRHYGSSNGNNVHQTQQQSSFGGGSASSGGMQESSFQGFSSSGSYPNYVSSSFEYRAIGGGCDSDGRGIMDDHNNSRMETRGDSSSEKMINGEETASDGFEHQQQITENGIDSGGMMIAVRNHSDENGSADSSDSSDGSCALPVSPPPPELGAVLKKSICETALA